MGMCSVASETITWPTLPGVAYSACQKCIPLGPQQAAYACTWPVLAAGGAKKAWKVGYMDCIHAQEPGRSLAGGLGEPGESVLRQTSELRVRTDLWQAGMEPKNTKRTCRTVGLKTSQ